MTCGCDEYNEREREEYENWEKEAELASNREKIKQLTELCDRSLIYLVGLLAIYRSSNVVNLRAMLKLDTLIGELKKVKK